MKLTNHYKKTSETALVLVCIFLLQNETALAWDGIDLKNNSAIQIESGNLVREGSIIDFFDSTDGNYHSGKVLIMNSASNATELTIEDFTEKHKERFFLMND